jgi:hypothetical protein
MTVEPAVLAVLTGSRVESWWVEHLTRSGASLGVLDGVQAGSVQQNVNAVISGGGTLTIDELGQGVDWLADRLRVWWKVSGAAGDEEWPLGTFLPSVPTSQHSDTDVVWSVDLLDTVSVLAEDAVTAAVTVAAGQVVTTAITSIITAAGEEAALTPSTETLTADLTWPAGTSRLRIVNDLLRAINYFSIRADGWGRLAAGPYRSPSTRPVAWEFTPGAAAVHVADMSREQDLYKVPNQVILLTAAGPDAESLTSVAVNSDPGSPLSTVSRGRTITVVEEGVEATSQSVLDDIAARRLLELSATTAKIDLQHAALPLSINDVVTVDTTDPSTGAAVTRRGVVQTWSLDLAVGAQTRTTLLEVA